jgi:hypothetical protein
MSAPLISAPALRGCPKHTGAASSEIAVTTRNAAEKSPTLAYGRPARIVETVSASAPVQMPNDSINRPPWEGGGLGAAPVAPPCLRRPSPVPAPARDSPQHKG